MAGLLFSNQTGGGAKIVSQFKNASNYITIQGNKIIANATSIDSLTALDLNPSDSVKIQNLALGDITVPATGSDIIRNSGDANDTLRARDTQGVWEFRNRNLRCMNPSNPANGTEMILHDTGGDYRLRIGSTTTATVGIGRQYNASYHLPVGGTSNFNEVRVENDATFLGQQLLSTKSRVFQRSDADNSLNIIGEKEINFSLQTTRGDDSSTGSIALQLNDNPSGIAMNRATTVNQTLNVIGKITASRFRCMGWCLFSTFISNI